MIYLNEIGERITEDEALAIGTWDTVYKDCTQIWVESTPEIGEYVTVAEYPNGGADVEWRVLTPATGKWVAYDDNGNEYQAEEEPPADFPHDAVFYETVEFRYARPKTDAEIMEEEQRALQIEHDREHKEIMDALPDAVAELSEMVSDNTIDTADIMDAIAELSEIVSNLMEGE